MDFDKICRDIKDLKIQGAINVAKAGANAFYKYSKTIKSKPLSEQLKLLKQAAKKLEQTRATEPALRNALAYYFYKLNITSSQNFNVHLELKHNKVLNHFEDSEKKIVKYGSRKIKDGMVVYTHCHSSTVCKILIQAKKNGTKFEVHNTETRPLFQGRKTAKELSKAGIKVTHYVDSAARHALKKADIFLIGADAITTTKVINKLGSEMFAIMAHELDIPVFCCTDSWKFDADSIEGFDEEIEKRIVKEVWPKAPLKIKIYNYAFDKISPHYLTGIISELGVYNHSVFVEEAEKRIGITLREICP